MAEGPSSWRPSVDTFWLFVGQAAVALVVAGMIYSRFTAVEAASAETARITDSNREQIIVLVTQLKNISDKLDEISKDVKALREKP